MRLTVGPLSEGPRNFDEDDAAAVVVGGTMYWGSNAVEDGLVTGLRRSNAVRHGEN
jgi:hypothetical protein